MARNAAGASLVASAVLGWTWEEDWLLQHRIFGAGITSVYCVRVNAPCGFSAYLPSPPYYRVQHNSPSSYLLGW